jgi:hypothetical protein
MAESKIDKLTDYAATFPNEIDRKKLEDTLQEVRTDVKKVADTYKSVGLLTGAGPVPDRVLEPVIPTKRGQIPIRQRPQLE